MARIIAIDGPAASGKSTVSRETARRLGWVYVDSGAVYRGITRELLRRGVDVKDATAVERELPAVRLDFFLDDHRAVRFRLGKINQDILETELRSALVSDSVSFTAAVPAVRNKVVEWLRATTRFGSLVMEGRDIGTVVFPDADLKFYLDADPAERARRRQLELTDGAEKLDVDTVKNSIQQRDARDSGRAAAPLRIAGDARVLDTTGVDIATVVDWVVQAASGTVKSFVKTDERGKEG